MKRNADFTCSAVFGQQSVLENKVTVVMSESSGNYTCSHNVTNPGIISINVYELSQQILARYYDNTKYEGSPIESFISNLNQYWGNADLITSQSDNVGILYNFYYLPSETNHLQLLVEADDSATLYSSDMNVTIQSGTSSLVPVQQGRLYHAQVRYAEYNGKAYLNVSQSHHYGSFSPISSSHFYYPNSRISSLDLSIKCPSGFISSFTETSPQCVPACGDSLLVEGEECDDGNMIDSDGCSSACKIEPNYVCSRNSSASSNSCVQCTSGYYQNSQKNQCITKCGDGLRVGAEACDDGNVLNLSGCNAHCEVEDNSVCNGGSITSPDICEVCEIGTSPDKNMNPQICDSVCGDNYRVKDEACDDGNTISGDGCSTKCEIEDKWDCVEIKFGQPDQCYLKDREINLSSSQKQQQAATFAAAGGSAISSLITSIFSGGSPSSLFSIIHQVQILLVLLLWKSYLPSKIQIYIHSLSLALVNFDIDWRFFIIFRKVYEWFNYEQPSDELFLAGIENGSSLLNLSGSIAFLISFGIFHIIFSSLHWINKNNPEKTCLMKTIEMIANFFTAELYYRLVVESFLMMTLSSFSELKRADTDEVPNFNSFISSIVICIFVLIFMTIVGYSFMAKSRKRKHEKRWKSIYNGLKKNDAAALYPFLFLFRRSAFSVIVITLTEFTPSLSSICFTIVTVVYTWYILIFKPFESTKDNLLEIINEFFYIGFCIPLIFLTEKKDWNSKLEIIYLLC
ncbi:unnamed protein product [Moneuplotes crassus]|uniref:PA14 domain-containing protein n=1 Tax=Euplotes crassus TaxID=5936 RepID=A0AAD1XXQ4_EUPCR|nr:unnamed protein product [Moneuplotes crassus]